MTDETVWPRSPRELPSKYTVALVGFMGAGKTTVGQELAQRLGWRFADLDQLIEAREHRTIPQIFKENGEGRFRESRFLILALGGGAFVMESVRGLLQARGVPAIWLDAPAEELFRRCEQPEVVRPLRRDAHEFTKLYEQRLSSYRQADLHVVTNGKEISAVAEEIIAALALQPYSRSAQ